MIRAILKFRGKFVREFTSNEPVVVIGRDTNANIRIENKHVLPQHCKISKRGSKYLIEDLGTPQGIEINGERIRMAQLKKGDVLNLGGNFSLEFDLPASEKENSGTPQQSASKKSTPSPPQPLLVAKDSLSEEKPLEFFTEATLRVSAVDEESFEPVAPEDGDLHIEPLSIDELEKEGLADDSVLEGAERKDLIEKINALILTLDDKELLKVAKILEILYG
ncbi:MAG: FHA domain-containing protein [Planctomycetota bacterium]|nr:MAG: FHA domain-containing protein [Planctomycetota bacterium]